MTPASAIGLSERRPPRIDVARTIGRMHVILREMTLEDVPIFLAHQRDPVAAAIVCRARERAE
jgi:hypothetical protein